MKFINKQIWDNYFDIVILPPKEISDYSIDLSKELSKYGTKWQLGVETYLPHISLYHIAVKPDKYQYFINDLRGIVENFSPGYIRTTDLEPNLLIFDKPEWIQELYLRIIKSTVKYYDWEYGTENSWPLERFPEQMRNTGKKFMKKYGTPMVGVNFRPHVSITSFNTPPPNLTVKKARRFKFKPDSLYVCELGPSHSCQRIVSKISFKHPPAEN